MGYQAKLKKLRKLQNKEQSTRSSSQLEIWMPKIAIVAALFSILFLAFIVLFKDGLPAGHDIAAHASRSRMMYEALTQGQFPARWVEWAYFGSSEPLFNYYQPGLYYVVFLIHLIVGSLNTSLKILVLLLWWGCGLFMFLFMRKYGTLSGVLSSVLFVFTPYIISDVLVRAAYPELMAICFFLGVFWTSDRLLATERPIYCLLISLFLPFILMSHLPTLVILSGVLGVYVLLECVLGHVKKKGFILLCVAGTIGIGLSATYLLPAIYELPLVQNQFLTSDTYDFHQHFVYFSQFFSTFWGYGRSLPGPIDEMSFQVGLLQIGILLVTVVFVVRSYVSKKELPFRKYILMWLLFIPYAVFFMHQMSLLFWENYRFISFIQYPWRFLMIVAVSCSVLAGILLSLLKSNLYKSIAVLVCLILIFVLYRTYLHPSVYLPYTFFNIDEDSWRESNGIKTYAWLEYGYLPKGVDIVVPKNANIPRWNVLKGEAKVTEKKMYYHNFVFDTVSKEGFVFTLNVHYFPKWIAYVDNVEVPIDYKNEYDFMNIIVPPGTHTVEFKFTDTTIRKVANDISLISIITLVGLHIYFYLNRKSFLR